MFCSQFDTNLVPIPWTMMISQLRNRFMLGLTLLCIKSLPTADVKFN